jgi:hypothetical protein
MRDGIRRLWRRIYPDDTTRDFRHDTDDRHFHRADPVLLLALAALLSSHLAPLGGSADSAKIARDVVARFYAWYVPLAMHTPGADMRALRDSRWHFDPALVNALRADSAAAAQSPDEIVGLDMDPFLNSQDPCDRYSPIAVRRQNGSYFVAVRGSGGCAAHTEADVTVRLVFQGANAVFLNFVYSSKPKDDLLSLLASLAASRARQVKPPTMK